MDIVLRFFFFLMISSAHLPSSGIVGSYGSFIPNILK